MAKQKKEPDIAELLEGTCSVQGESIEEPQTAVMSEAEGAFYDSILESLDSAGKSGSGELFTLKLMATPEECLAVRLPTAEAVIAHIVDLYPKQFEQTRAVLNQNPDLNRQSKIPPQLDGFIASFFNSRI